MTNPMSTSCKLTDERTLLKATCTSSHNIVLACLCVCVCRSSLCLLGSAGSPKMVKLDLKPLVDRGVNLKIFLANLLK